MTETLVILPDTHFPDHDKRAVNAVIEFIGEIQPDQVIHIGDLMDFPQPSRWTKDTRAEFEGSVYEDAEACVEQVLKPLREVYAGPVGVHEGNHDERTRVYMEKYAPALAKTDFFNYDKLLKFEDLGIEALPEFYQIAPGWVTTHGHRGGIRLNQNAGLTALNAARRFGQSVVMGHTHRQGICSYTVGIEGNANTLTGVEVGHLADPKKMTYLKGATANWQAGFSVVSIEGKHVHAQLIPITKGRFIYHGRTFKS